MIIPNLWTSKINVPNHQPPMALTVILGMFFLLSHIDQRLGAVRDISVILYHHPTWGNIIGNINSHLTKKNL
jgi:hypothetical protein